LAILVLTAAATLVAAAESVRDHDIVPEDYFDLISLGNL